MATAWRFALLLSMLLMVSRGLSLASEEAGSRVRSDHGDTSSPSWATENRTDSGHDTTGDSGHDDSSHDDSGNGDSGNGDSGHGDSGNVDSGHGDSGHGDSGHGGEPITTLPIVTWKWHHVSTPYLVALWILVCWICKLSEFHQVLSMEG